MSTRLNPPPRRVFSSRRTVGGCWSRTATLAVWCESTDLTPLYPPPLLDRDVAFEKVQGPRELSQRVSLSNICVTIAHLLSLARYTANRLTLIKARTEHS